MRRRLRLLAAIMAAAMMPLTLAACDHFASDPIAFTVVEDTAIVRFCLPTTVTSINVKTYPDDEDYNGRVVWSAEGEATLEGGSELPLGVAPEGMTVSLEGDVNFLNETFAVEMDTSDSYGPHHFFAHVEAGVLNEDEWTYGYGPIETPCVREPCPPAYACINQWPEPTGFPTNRAPTWAPIEP